MNSRTSTRASHSTERKKIIRENGATVLDDLSAFVRRYMVLSQAQSYISALWVVHTHAIDAAEFTPYLHIYSPVLRSGKTRLLKILSMVVAKPWLTGRVTSAVLVRKTHKEHPTLLLDESDTAFSAGGDYAETLRGVLNTGFDRDGIYSMCVQTGNDWDPRDFSTFSPKAIAGIGRLPDTVEDRSIPMKLKRKLPTETCEPFRKKLVKPLAAELRVRTVRWVKQNLKRLRDFAPSMPEELNDRQLDVCEPLLAIADLAGGQWPLRTRRALVQLLCTGSLIPEDSVGLTLLSDIRACFEKHRTDRLQTRRLLDYLNSLEESPWAEFKAGRHLTPQGLAKLLKSFDLRPHDIRFENGTQKGYLRGDFEECWQRYLSTEGQETLQKGQQGRQASVHAGSISFATGQQRSSVASSKNDRNAANMRSVADVALTSVSLAARNQKGVSLARASRS